MTLFMLRDKFPRDAISSVAKLFKFMIMHFKITIWIKFMHSKLRFEWNLCIRGLHSVQNNTLKGKFDVSKNRQSFSMFARANLEFFARRVRRDRVYTSPRDTRRSEDFSPDPNSAQSFSFHDISLSCLFRLNFSPSNSKPLWAFLSFCRN